ncbi:MFS general substrate transporter [Heliocybe sulcata]|uniref:MFS general substrate transporter n=1 Tax=Heliocybe sulcata TaxID=5364 RepID=A0A5C3NJ75_9AGAM|nr:MFS general substrate transporter [Heliocybe sulcata]
MASACVAYLLLGWGDGLTGTVLPYFEAEFHLSFMISSLLFAGSTTGFAIGTLSIERATRTFGLVYQGIAKPPFMRIVTPRLCFHPIGDRSNIVRCRAQARIAILLMGCIAHVIFLILMGSRDGFASMFVAYVTAGFARSWITATLNAYIASTPTKGLGYILCFWSIGATISPLVCQTLISTGIPWSQFCFGSLIISFLNISLILFAFLPSAQERSERRSGCTSAQANGKDLPVLTPGTPLSVEKGEDAVRSVCQVTSARTSSKRRGKQLFEKTFDRLKSDYRTGLYSALTTPYIWMFSIYLWIYSGNASTTAGWLRTFWTSGMLTRRLPGVALAMNLLIMLINSSTANTVSASIVGLVFGPVFPGTLGLSNEVIDEDIRMISMAVMSSFASFGSALYPFIAGILANAHFCYYGAASRPSGPHPTTSTSKNQTHGIRG